MTTNTKLQPSTDLSTLDRLYGEELSMISKRQLRDLRNSATIEMR